LRTKVGELGLIVNRVKGELSPEIKKAIHESGLQVIALIPEDPNVAGLEMKGRPVTELPEESPLQLKVKDIAEGLLL
jgi:CO dehydrogenase nickel-insertion accessory protein CooC1